MNEDNEMRVIAARRISDLGPGTLVALALIVLVALALVPALTAGGCGKQAGAAQSSAASSRRPSRAIQ